MDRKSLLAIVLSTIVVIVFYTFVIPKPKRPEGPVATKGDAPVATQGADTESVAGGQPEIGSPSREDVPLVPPSTEKLSDAAASEETLVLETGLYRAEFTNRGGQILSWKLKQFKDPFGQWVELVPDGQAEVGMILEADSGTIDMRNTLFSMRKEPSGDGTRVIFEAGGDGAPRVRKAFTLHENDYQVDLKIEIGEAPGAGLYRLGWYRGIPRAEKNPKQYKMAFGAVTLIGKNRETIRPKHFKKSPTKNFEGNVRWAGMRNKYFTAMMIPPPQTSSRVRTSGNNETHEVNIEIEMPVLGGATSQDFLLYLGPIDYERLKHIGFGLEKTVNLGWKFIRPLSKLLLLTMEWMYRFIPNYGVVIILISILAKGIFYPLTKSSIKSMRAMQKLQPEMSALREKYKNDNQKLQAETMALYKTHKVNPVGGCLPIVVQMPVFIALYRVLANSIAMRQANFVWWIDDLSSPDTLFMIGGFAVHILPIVLLVFTVLQQVLTPSGDQRQKTMGYMMPLVTVFIFYGFPAGLNLYWTINSVMTVAQQWVIHREEPSTKAATT